MSVQALSCAFAVRGLSPSEKLVLLALANFANENMQCWPSQDRLASDTELSARTVWGALKSLEERKILTRASRKRADGSRTTDVFTLHFAMQVWSEPVAEFASRPRKDCEGPSQPLLDDVAAVARLTTFEPSVNHQPEPDDGGDAGEPDWSARLEEAKDAAGEAVDLASPAVHLFRDLKSLCEPASGEPCEWGEVLDAIRFRAAKWKARGGARIRSWAWVKDQAEAYRDRRLRGAAPVEMIHAQPHRLDPSASSRASRRGVWTEVLDEERREATSRRAGS